MALMAVHCSTGLLFSVATGQNKADKLVSITSSDNVSLDIKLYLSLEELLSYSVEIGKVSSSNNNVS